MSEDSSNCILSVIIPVYNVKHYLQTCVDSVLVQETIDDDIEILLIDDGSTDGSSTLCDQLEQENKLIHCFHKENGGLSDARNYGMKKANGRYIVFLDSDDFWEQGYIKEIREILLESPDVDMIYGNFLQYFEQDKKKIYPHNFLTREEVAGKSGMELLMLLQREDHQFSSACKSVYSRKVLLDNQLFFKKGLLCEDVFWSPGMYLTMKNCSVLLHNYYCYRKQRKNSITNTYSYKLISDAFYIADYWVQYIEHTDYEPAYKQIFINEMAVHFRSYLQRIYSLSRPDRKKALPLAKKNIYILGKSSRSGHKKLKKLIDTFGLRPILILLNLRFRIWRLQKTA